MVVDSVNWAAGIMHGMGKISTKSIDITGVYYHLIIQWLCNLHPDFERGQWKRINHIIKITFPWWWIWLIGLVGVKDRRIDTVFHPRLRSPILHPYAWCQHYAWKGDVSTEIPSILMEIFTISSYNNYVITIRISKCRWKGINHIIKKTFPWWRIWLIGLVGVKDRRIDTIFHPGMRSPILHPYAWCRHYAWNGYVSTEIPSIWLEFFIISSHN